MCCCFSTWLALSHFIEINLCAVSISWSLWTHDRMIRTFVSVSVTRLGDLLDFGQVLKAFGNNQFAKISHILSQFFVRVSKSIIFLVKSFLGNFYRHLAIFSVNKTRKKISVQILPENLFFKWAILDLFFVYFRSFSNRQYKFYNKSMQKMSI